MLVITMRGGSAYYYFTYFLNRPDLIGLYLGLQMTALALGAAGAPLMTRHIDKAKLIMLLMTITGVLSIAFYFVPRPEVNGVVTVEGNQPATLVAQEMLPEPANTAQNQWQEHQRLFWVFTKRVNMEGETGPELSVSNADGMTVSVIQTTFDEQGNPVQTDSGSLPVELIVIFILNFLISFCLGPKAPITWSMYADAADYNEWSTGRRATAMTFAAATFSKKVGSAFGSAGILWMLAAFGYVANEAQSGASLGGIVLLQTAAPGIFAFISVAFLTRYRLTGKQLETIQQDLKERDGAKANMT